MRVGKQGLVLLGTHIIVSILETFLFIPLMTLWDNMVYNWIIGLLSVLLLWLIVYIDLSTVGQKDLKRNTFQKHKGFLVGFIASIPIFILYFFAIFFIDNEPNYLEIALRIILMPYSKIFTAFEGYMPQIAIIPIMILIVVSGFSYLDGLRRRKKILEVIEQSDAKRLEKSKTN